MKSNIQARLQQLEAKLRRGDGVILVDEVPGGYRLPDGNIVADLSNLHKQYNIIVIDDL